MNSYYNKKDRYSTYSVWEDLSIALMDDLNANLDNSSPTSYKSPIIISCKNWMEKAGEAIKQQDKKNALIFLWNILHYTNEVISSSENGRVKNPTNEFMKPFREYQAAAIILSQRLEMPAF